MSYPANAIQRARAPRHQRGMATILIIILAGLAITATSLGMMYAVRNTQEAQMASHALVPAESRAWSGVELMRLYLTKKQALGQLSDITAGAQTQTDAPGITFQIVNGYNSAATTPRIVVNVTGTSGAGTRSAASATIQAVYTVVAGTSTGTGGGGSGTGGGQAPITLQQGISTSGDIKILGGNNANFVVDGDVSLSGSATGIQTIQSTGDIVLSGGIQVPEAFANGSLTMSGSAAVTLKGSAIKWINNNSGGGQQGVLRTNGYINMNGGSATETYAIGDITMTNGGVSIGKVRSGANVTCPGTWWNNFTSIQSAKTTNCPTGAKVVTKVPTSELTPLTPITIAKTKIDANDYKDSANYTFEFVNGKKKVTVKNINGLTDGDYYLVNFVGAKRTYYDALCMTVDSNNNCTSPESSIKTICNGQTNNPCFSYDTAKSLWKVTGKNLAPGVLWFKGNLEMGNGEYYNTTIASGNIATSGSHKLYALNFAGYDVVCANAFKKSPTADFAGLYPTNFCDLTAKKMKANATGNIAYLAGIYTGTTFSGGTINIGASSEIFGSVIAGNQLLTGGSTVIHGYVNAGGQGAATTNNWGGSTTIDLTGLPDTFDPGSITPPTTGSGNGNGSGTCTSNCPRVDVTWTRYL